MYEKDYILNPATCSCKNCKYLASIIDDWVITCDEITDADAEAKSYDDESKTIPTNFYEKNVTCTTIKFLYFTCVFINYHSIIDSC